MASACISWATTLRMTVAAGALGGEGRHVRSDVGGDPARRGQGESPTP
jgi:hypothetical protein